MGYYPRTDIAKTSEGVLIEAGLSGLSYDDVEVELVGSAIVIRGRIPERDDYSRYTAKELYRGRFTRKYPLNIRQHNVDKIRCEMHNGLLSIFIPYKSNQVQESNIHPIPIIDVDISKDKDTKEK